MDSTVTSTEVTIESTVLWSCRLAAWISSLFGSKFFPVSLSSLDIESECLLEINVLFQIALSLVVSESLGTVRVSSLEESPSEEVLFGGFNCCLVLNRLDIIISIEIALSHVVVHIRHAVLVSLFLMTELLPMLLCLGNWVSILESSLQVWISIQVAISLVVINVLFK